MQTFRASENIDTEDEDELQYQLCKMRFSQATNLHIHVCTGATEQINLPYYVSFYASEKIDFIKLVL